jgi:hypothetical protein
VHTAHVTAFARERQMTATDWTDKHPSSVVH